jgi:SAM-dependent methyltransferase
VRTRDEQLAWAKARLRPILTRAGLLQAVPTRPPQPPELTAAGSRRRVPVPVGTNRDTVFHMLSTLSIELAPPEEIRAYLNEDFERFLITLSLVGSASGQALEIGANPYFTTVLLREFTDLDLSLTNSFSPTATGSASQHVTYESQPGQRTEATFEYALLNVETTTFPYPDGVFDVVVFCEVIEHLLTDPVAALLEIHRVLSPSGRLILSTPNVARLENVARLVAGTNLYDPYSGYGAYGRHNREFTRHELVRLLGFCGFVVDDHFTADVHPHHASSFVDLDQLAPLLASRSTDLGQYIFCRARRLGDPKAGRPMELFRSLPPGELRSWDE